MAVRIQFKKLTDQTPKFGDAFGGDRMDALAKLSPAAPPAGAPADPPADAPKTEDAAPAKEAEAAAAPAIESAPGEPAAPGTTAETPAAEEPGPEMVPLPGAAEFQLPVAPPSATPDLSADAPVSEAIMQHSSKPALMRAGATIFKWGMLGAVLLAGGFYLMRGVLFPVVNELRKDKNAPAVVDKQASTLVQSVQQTKQVIAKNDANVEYLNQIMGEKEKEKEKPAPVVEPPPVVAPRPPAPAVPNASAKEREYARQREAIANYEVSGVRDGAAPRLFHEGQVVRFGDIIDRQLGLRFVGVNADERMVLFANADNEIFKKPY